MKFKLTGEKFITNWLCFDCRTKLGKVNGKSVEVHTYQSKSKLTEEKKNLNIYFDLTAAEPNSWKSMASQWKSPKSKAHFAFISLGEMGRGKLGDMGEGVMGIGKGEMGMGEGEIGMGEREGEMGMGDGEIVTDACVHLFPKASPYH